MKDVNSVIDNIVKNLWLTRQSYDLEKLGIDASASLKKRFKDFPYIVRVNKKWQEWMHIHTDAEFWCDEYCSDGYVNHWLEGYQVDDDFIVDLSSKKIQDRENFEQAFFFGFKNEADATMFTLRWLDNR